jgi:pimeloyl-ACP methyl ester carboxylesterase
MDSTKLTTRSGLTFDAGVAGPADGPLVLLLHGFPQSRHAWTDQLTALAAAGFRAVAPDQRGYSPGARPDPADLANYAIDQLVADVIDIAEACGGPGARFHLAGIDWGGQVAWATAAAHADRLLSLSVLSRPHPNAFTAAFDSDPDQQHRSRHHRAFHDRDTGPMMLADGAASLRQMLTNAGLPPRRVEDYLSVVGNPAAMEAALAWYRATGLRIDLPPITVPTCYLWGDDDVSVGRAAAEGTAAYVSAPYRFELLEGVGHFSSDEAPEQVSAILVDHMLKATAPQVPVPGSGKG